MTGKQRLQAALSHQTADRYPIDLGGTASSGIALKACMALYERLGISDTPYVFDLLQMLAMPCEALRASFDVDVMFLPRPRMRFGIDIEPCREIQLYGARVLAPMGFEPRPLPGGGFGIYGKETMLARMPSGGHYFDICHHKHAHVLETGSLDGLTFSGWADEEFVALSKNAIQLARTDRGIVGGFGGSLLETGQRMWGFENFMEGMLLEPDLVEAWLDKLMDAHLHALDRYLETVGKWIDVVQFSDDLGTQNAPMISPALYRKLLKPRHAMLFDRVHRMGLKVLLHCCGAISCLIPDLIEAGVDAINPVQISAEGMDAKVLKREFGQSLTFWGGGIDTQSALPRAPIPEIRRQALELIDIFSPGGGFVFAPVHNIQPDIEPDRIIALYDAARGYHIS